MRAFENALLPGTEGHTNYYILVTFESTIMQDYFILPADSYRPILVASLIVASDCG